MLEELSAVYRVELVERPLKNEVESQVLEPRLIVEDQT